MLVDSRERILPLLQLIGVFHWGRHVTNYAFLESRDQCLHGRIGSFVVSLACRGELVKYQTCLTDWVLESGKFVTNRS